MASFVTLKPLGGQALHVNLDRVSYLEETVGRVRIYFAADHQLEVDSATAKPILDAVAQREDGLPSERVSWTDEQIRAAAEAFENLRDKA